MRRGVMLGAAIAAIAAIAATVLSIIPGCTERGSYSDLYVLEELETASRPNDPEKRVKRLNIFAGNHPRHAYRVLAYTRVFEALARDIGDTDRASAYFNEVLSSEREDKIRGQLWYRRFAYLWDADRAAAVSLAEELCGGPERYYRLFFYLALYLAEDETCAGTAERCFLKASELAPPGRELAQVLGEYGLFLENAGRMEEALSELKGATAYEFANEPLGRILWARGEWEAAIDAYIRLVARVPGARERVHLDSLYAVVHPDAWDLGERIMEYRMVDGIELPDARFVCMEGREYRLGRFRGTPLVLLVFSPT